MDFSQWEPLYRDIRQEFGFSLEADRQAARLLHSLVGANSCQQETLRSIIAGRRVTVCGAAPALEEQLSQLSGVVVAADEATSLVMERRCPDIIATDLDGNVEDQIAANRQGSVVVLHAHGDNTAALRRYAPRFPGPVVLTTQAQPFDRVYNFGGFTDGDRAYLLARHFGAASVHLLGFDFEHPQPKPGKDLAMKRKKLRWARRLIEAY